MDIIINLLGTCLTVVIIDELFLDTMVNILVLTRISVVISNTLFKTIDNTVWARLFTGKNYIKGGP